jgi:methyl-accepting chemotaxis protein
MPRLIPRLSLFWQFFLALIVAALVPLLATWYVARGVTINDARHLAEAQLRLHAAQIADRTDAWLQLNYQSLIEHASTTAIRSMLPELQRPVLTTIADHQPWTILAFTIGPEGMSVSRSDNLAPVNYADREYFRTALSGQPIGQQVSISRTSHKPAWIFGVPIKDEMGRVLGVLAKTDGLNEITDLLANAKIGDSGRAVLMAPDGKLVAMTGASFDTELRDYSKHPLFAQREALGGILHYVDDGRPTMAALQRVRFGWLVAVQIDEAEAMRPVQETDRTMLILLLVATLVAAAAAALVAPAYARPLQRLTSIADEMSRGRFDHEVPEVERQDEIGELARAIDRMTRSLQMAMARLTQKP